MRFFSTTPIEDIEAENHQTTALLQADGAFAFRVPVLGFRFEKALMEEHFNENYLESHTYPNGSFEGSIDDFTDAMKDGEFHDVLAKGVLTIHGVEQQREIPSTVQWNGTGFVAVTPSSISVDVDLGYTPAAGQGTVTNTAGDDAVIPLANGTNAGLSLNNYTTAEKTKLAGVEDGANVNVNADWNAVSGDAEILNKPTLFSGDYNDLTNQPDIPSNTSDLTNDGEGAGNPFATTDQLFSGDYGDLTNQPTIPSELSDLSDVDTSGAQNGQLLRYNGASWEPGSPGAVSVDLGYTPAADKGTVTNDAGTDAEIPLATGTNAGLSLNNFTATDKNKLDNLPDPGAITDGTVTSVDSGNGLTGGPITNAGTLSVQADGDTITVGAGGIKVTDGKFATPDQIPDVADYLPLAGGEMSGSVTTPEQTVTSIAFDLSAGPFWLIPGSFDVPDPTGAVPGMSGLIRFTAAPTSWGSAFQFAGGTPVSPTKLPAVSPFYVQASGSVYVGPAVEELI